MREPDAAPRVGVLEISRRLGVARATFATLEISQGRGRTVLEHLHRQPVNAFAVAVSP